MKRKCERCGRRFESQSKRTRFCRDVQCVRERTRERKRAQRDRSVAGAVVGRGTPEVVGSLVEAARVELERAGRVESLIGRQALHLAEQLDSGRSVGTAVSALHKELRATMEAALATVAVAGPVDELRRKRLERLGLGA